MQIGVIRKIDDLGRLVIPVEIRRSLNIKIGDPVEMFATEEGVLIKSKGSRLKKLEDYTENELLKELELRKQIRAYKNKK